MSGDRASPVCYAGQADDAYMGYAGREEIVAALTELLEAERAGARVALRSAREAVDARLVALMKSVQRDEARWCAMLSRQLKRVGATPSRRCGAFYGKAMAIADPVERLLFLNKGQTWVVRKLEALLPRVRDDILHQSLRDMLVSHVDNIRQADDVAASLPR